jgi:undecaprenyl-diphosphatase
MTLLTIVDLDRLVFKLINQEWANGFFDYFLYFWRNKYTWIPLYIFIITYLIVNLGKRSYWIIFFLILTFALTDFISSGVVKPMIERPRPCHVENQALNTRLLVPCGSGYSFTSSHAANHFGIAFFLIFAIRKRNRLFAVLLFIWAFLVGYAQVYVGVHFPLDIICGALLGIGIAILTKEMYNVSMKKMAI